MSNYLAVATVTEVLVKRLRVAMGRSVAGADVRPRRPADSVTQSNEPVAHLHLYRVTPNTGWCNRDLPTIRAPMALQRSSSRLCA